MAQPSESSDKFHIAMFPWFAMGHLTPFLHLSNELAARGHKISFLLPKKAANQLQHLNLHPHLITFYTVIVPHVEGLTEGTEIASDIPTSHLLSIAMDLTRDQIQGFLKSSVDDNHKIDMVFYDLAYWVPEITRPLGIKSICYSIISAAAYAFFAAYNKGKDKNPINNISESRQQLHSLNDRFCIHVRIRNVRNKRGTPSVGVEATCWVPIIICSAASWL